MAKSRKVLLIYPGGFNSLFPEIPIPLLYIAWALRKKEFEVEICDTRLQDIDAIEDKNYLFVGITSMTGEMLKSALAAAKHIRTLNANTPIVWGGIHVSLLSEQSLKSPYVDVIVRGEGELTVQELAEVFYEGRGLSGLGQVAGISYKHQGVQFKNPDRKFMDLDEIDIKLPYDLIDINRYANPMFPVHTSRGCPWRCTFCYNVAFSKRRYRAKSPQRVLDEIEYIVNDMGYNKLSFAHDDEFFINIKWVKEICQGIIDRNIKIEWESFCRFDSFCRIDDELLGLLERSGCQMLSFGGESGSVRILDEIVKKDIKLEQILETTQRMSKIGIRQVVSFMSALPTETLQEQEQTFELMDKLALMNPNIYLNGMFLYTPYPGTPLYDLIVEEYNYRSPQSLEEWSEFGIYRNVLNTWSPKWYVERCKSISILTRFPFYQKSFTLKDVSKTLGSSRLAKFPFNIAYYIFAKLAILRWKHRFFRFPLELIILEKVLLKLRGFV